jgi:hypothetical protein
MAYKMKPLPEGVTLESLFTHASAAYRQVARVFFNGHAVTTKELHSITDMSMGSIWATVKAFRESRLIYVTKWLPPEVGSTNALPVYRAGNKPDAVKPKPKNPMAAINSKRFRDNQRTKVFDPNIDTTVFIELAKALVPQRSAEEVYEVNRNYLNWISGGEYDARGQSQGQG